MWRQHIHTLLCCHLWEEGCAEACPVIIGEFDYNTVYSNLPHSSQHHGHWEGRGKAPSVTYDGALYRRKNDPEQRFVTEKRYTSTEIEGEMPQEKIDDNRSLYEKNNAKHGCKAYIQLYANSK